MLPTLTFTKTTEVWKSLTAASKQYNVPLHWVARRAMRLHNRELFSMNDIIAWGLLDPDIPTGELERYMSREARVRLQTKLNDRTCEKLVSNKARFHEFCVEQKLPTPITLGIFLPPVASDQTEHRRYWLNLFDKHHNEDLICKPVIGLRGEGLFVAHASDTDYRVDNQHFSKDELYDYILKAAVTPGLVIQRRERSHPAIQRLSGTDALQTARIVTFLDKNNACKIMFSRFKFIVGENHIDNFSWGTLGNLTSDVDPNTGIVQAVFTTIPGQSGMVRISNHPDTGATLVGAELPLWKETVALACDGARKLPRVRTLGWDVGITATKPVVLETNPRWIVSPPGPMKRPVSRRAWKRLMRPS